MQPDNKYVTPRWSSHWVFMLAATGAAIGLGNFWRFPHMVGERGGAFVIVYVLFLLLIGVPLILSEMMLGRQARRSPIRATHLLSHTEQAEPNPFWLYLGWLMTITGILILSYLSVIGGWMLAYVVRTAIGIFEGMELVAGVRLTFSEFISDPEKQLAWHTVFLVMAVCVVGGKFRQGVETAAKILIPTIFLLLLLLLSRAVVTGAFSQSMHFLFTVDFSRLTFMYVMDAAQQAFFSLSLGLGVMLVYSAYLSETVSLTRTSLCVVSLDTLVALFASLAIYPIILVSELEPTSGVTLVFQTLPMAYGSLSSGAYWGTLFFLLLVLTMWTSAIALLEPSVARLCEKYSWSRAKAATVSGMVVWLLGLISILSFSHWNFSFEFLGVEKTNGVLDILVILTSNFLLPIICILIALFAGWIVSQKRSRHELGQSRLVYTAWLISTRFVVPFLLGSLFVYFLLSSS